jgi:tRNA-binding EMAP/Myf-like protein
METISFDEFKKVEIRIGKILSAEKVEGSDKLLKLSVDFGPMLPSLREATTGSDEAISELQIAVSPSAPRNDERDIRQIIAGIAQYYAPEALVGKECPFAYNLAPRMLKGLESQGMILCASAPLSISDPTNAGSPSLMHRDKEIPAGSVVK